MRIAPSFAKPFERFACFTLSASGPPWTKGSALLPRGKSCGRVLAATFVDWYAYRHL